MNYFKSASTVAEIKYCYRKLAEKYQPDQPEGDLLIMHAINRQYLDALKRCNRHVSYSSDQSFTYHFDETIEDTVIEMYDILLSLKMSGVKIYLIGTWLWITGSNTKEYKEDLKVLGCRWHRNRQCWFWHPNHHPSFQQTRDRLTGMAHQYGVSAFNQQSDQPLN